MKNNLYLVYVLFALLISSCRKDIGQKIENLSATENQIKSEGGVVLGKKLENPYSVVNMRKAYARLNGKSSNSISDIEGSAITTSHYYVRFLPTDTAQINALKSDTSLNLYQIPLDYEIINSGCDTQDTSQVLKPVWLYTAVPQNFKFNTDIKYEILENLFIPELVPISTTSTLSKNKAPGNFALRLVNEAMKITHNEQDTVDLKAENSVSFTATGRVRVLDNRLNDWVPLEGVRIRCRRWFNIKNTTTDAQGNYSISGFGGKVNYALFYDTDDFDVRAGSFSQAWNNGPHQSSPWDVNISSGVQRFYANVFRGARRYHEGNIGGLRRPDVWKKIKYLAFDNDRNFQGINYGNTVGIIKIARYEDIREFNSDEIFSTTVHETAHSAHLKVMNMGDIQMLFNNVNAVIRESWAVGVEWYITQMEYRERGIANYGGPDDQVSAGFPSQRGYQSWSGRDTEYTPLFIDLVDNLNQRQKELGIVNDNVTGFTLEKIEPQLKHIYGIYTLSLELKKIKPMGVTDAQIDELLGHF